MVGGLHLQPGMQHPSFPSPPPSTLARRKRPGMRKERTGNVRLLIPRDSSPRVRHLRAFCLKWDAFSRDARSPDAPEQLSQIQRRHPVYFYASGSRLGSRTPTIQGKEAPWTSKAGPKTLDPGGASAGKRALSRSYMRPAQAPCPKVSPAARQSARRLPDRATGCAVRFRHARGTRPQHPQRSAARPCLPFTKFPVHRPYLLVLSGDLKVGGRVEWRLAIRESGRSASSDWSMSSCAGNSARYQPTLPIPTRMETNDRFPGSRFWTQSRNSSTPALIDMGNHGIDIASLPLRSSPPLMFPFSPPPRAQSPSDDG